MARLGQQSNRYRSWYLQQVQKKQPYYNTSALRVASRSYLGYSNQIVRGERGPEGVPGPQGATGQAFQIKYTYSSLALLLASTPAEKGCFALVAGTLSEAHDDYGKLYYYHDQTSGWQFVADMSIQGVEGTSILAGIGSPTAGLGNDGDLYIDLALKDLYGPKSGMIWGSPVSLKGDQGDPGTQGGTWTGDIDMDGYDVTNVGEVKTSLLSLSSNIISNYGNNNSGGNIKIDATEGVCSNGSYSNRVDCEANSANWLDSKAVIINNAVRMRDYEDDAGGFRAIVEAGNSQDLQVGGQTNGDLLLNSLNYTKFYTEETYNFYNADASNEILKLDPSDGDGLSISNATGSDVHLKTFTTTDMTIQVAAGQLTLESSQGVTIGDIFTPDNTSAIKHSKGIAQNTTSVTVSSSAADHTPGTYINVPLTGYPSTTKGGQLAFATVVVNGAGAITSVDVTASGYNYEKGATIAIANAGQLGGTNSVLGVVNELESGYFTRAFNKRNNINDYFVPTLNSVNQYVTEQRIAGQWDHIQILTSDWMPSDASSTYNIAVYDWISGGTPGVSVGSLRSMSSYLEFWAYKEIPKGYKATSIDIWVLHKFSTDSSELIVYEKFWDNTPPVEKGTLTMTGNVGSALYQLDFTDIEAKGDNSIMINVDPAATTMHIHGAKIYIEEIV